MTVVELFKQFFLARLHTRRWRECGETEKQFAERCRNEALAALDDYEETLEMFDPETGDWSL